MRHRILLSLAVAATPVHDAGAKTVAETVALTSAQLKGHVVLYNEGWFIVTSTKEALDVSRGEFSTAGSAFEAARRSAHERTKQFVQAKDEIRQQSEKLKDSMRESAIKHADELSAGADSLAESQWRRTRAAFAGAYESAVFGSLSLGVRTREDWQELKQTDLNFFKDIRADLKDSEKATIMDEALESAAKQSSEGLWSRALTKASQEAARGYEKSGEEPNSLGGLGTLLTGYFSAVYHGLIQPTGQSIAQVAEASESVLARSAVGSFKIAKRTVYATGLSFYYASKIGYKVISPSLEAGLLASLALASAASVPVIVAGGKTLGTLNQVAVSTLPPATAGAQLVLASSAETAKYAALLTYDLARATGEAFVHSTKAGLVLGYNALTAIPTQILLGVATGAIFLVYDGPRLSLAYVTGNINGVPVAEAPIGTVFDMEKLERAHLEVKNLGDDPETIEKILREAEKDLGK